MRPEKVQDKKGKANVRKGSKDAKNSVLSSEPREILPFVNRIVCADGSKYPAPILGLCPHSPRYFSPACEPWSPLESRVSLGEE